MFLLIIGFGFTIFFSLIIPFTMQFFNSKSNNKYLPTMPTTGNMRFYTSNFLYVSTVKLKLAN